jgi:hypothetical protein
MYDIYRNTTDDRCRFALGKNGNHVLVTVGLNPSTATQAQADMTATKVERVAGQNGFDGFVLVNLCPIRATDFRMLPNRIDRGVMVANLNALEEVVAPIKDVTVWAAWGAPISARAFFVAAARAFVQRLARFSPSWQHFGPLTVDGHPRHPSRASFAWTFSQFEIASYLARLDEKGGEARRN